MTGKLIFSKMCSGNHRLPECKPFAVYFCADFGYKRRQKSKKNLPEKLASLRKKGLTQLDLAEKLNVSRQAISRWEVGSAIPSTDNLKILSDLYGVSVDYLLSDDEEDFSRSTDAQDPLPGEQKKKARFQNRRVICVGAAVILVILAVIISVAIVPDQKQKPVTPIEDMEKIVEDDYSTYTFSIEPIA